MPAPFQGEERCQMIRRRFETTKKVWKQVTNHEILRENWSESLQQQVSEYLDLYK